jgi:hypothetical protein
MSARSIVVIGTGAVSRDEVVDAAKVQLGTPLLQIDTDAVADRVAGIRRVASARVQREYPSSLRITIAERVPIVVKDFPDGPHLYDRDGVDFATAPPPPTLLTTAMFCNAPLPCQMRCMVRAVLSLPPPAPEPTRNSTVLTGFQPCADASADGNNANTVNNAHTHRAALQAAAPRYNTRKKWSGTKGINRP